MSMAEILDELPRLSAIERQTILRQLVSLDSGPDLEESPEMLAAIDAGIVSMESGPGISLEEARRELVL